MPRGGTPGNKGGRPSQDKITKSFRLLRELVEWLKAQPDQTKIVEKGIEMMMLGIQVWDVDIDLGYVVNCQDHVRLVFRRPPDHEVKQLIYKLREEYGWKVREAEGKDSTMDMLNGTFAITCTGANSDDVGNALGKLLEQEHGLKVRYCQFVPTGEGKSKYTQGVKELSLTK